MTLRVVAGELKGRRLLTPPAATTRPTTDKVREAIFNALTSLHVLLDARVADLYAGSGAMGIEALSRGASHCMFVERDRVAAQVIADNLTDLGLRARATNRIGDAIALAPTIDAEIAFVDPPYGFDDWPRLLRGIQAPTVIAEADAAIPAPPDWQQGRTKRYGRTWVTFLHRDERTELP